MTKTLTEQWREGKLPENTYYVQFICGRYGIYEFEQFKGFGFDNDLAYIKEVLAPVPSYDHFSQLVKKVKKLEQQLKSARNVIKKYDGVGTIGVKDKNGKLRICRPASQYLKRWGVK